MFCVAVQNQPLTYEVSYSSQGSDRSRLIYRGLNNTVVFKLPAGDPATNYSGRTLTSLLHCTHYAYVLTMWMVYGHFVISSCTVIKWTVWIWRRVCVCVCVYSESGHCYSGQSGYDVVCLCVFTLRVDIAIVDSLDMTLCVCLFTVRVDIAIVDSLDASTQVCSISVPVSPLNVTQRALYALVYLLAVHALWWSCSTAVDYSCHVFSFFSWFLFYSVIFEYTESWALQN